MMTQLDSLQQQVMNLQNTVSTQTAIIRTLVQQASENINSMKATIARMQELEQRNLASSSNQINSLSGEVQQLSASLDEAKGQISKLSGQVAQTQKMMETINAAPQGGINPANGHNTETGQGPGINAAAQGETNPGAQSTSASSASGTPTAGDASRQAPQVPPPPDPDVLYRSAYTDYTQGQYPLAIQGFQQYLEDYGNTDLASNAQFYIGDSYYLQKDYKEAIKEYDKCIEAYPDGNKAAAAYLKKGYALLALGQNLNGERQLNALVHKFPDTHEADLARQRLHRLTISQR